jgi:hypothetical protein
MAVTINDILKCFILFSPLGMYVVDKTQCRGDDPIEKAKII